VALAAADAALDDDLRAGPLAPDAPPTSGSAEGAVVELAAGMVAAGGVASAVVASVWAANADAAVAPLGPAVADGVVRPAVDVVVVPVVAVAVPARDVVTAALASPDVGAVAAPPPRTWVTMSAKAFPPLACDGASEAAAPSPVAAPGVSADAVWPATGAADPSGVDAKEAGASEVGARASDCIVRARSWPQERGRATTSNCRANTVNIG